MTLRMKWIGLSVFASVFLILAGLATPTVVSIVRGQVNALPQLPSSFFGTVTLDGQNVPAGTVVEALVDGVVVGSTDAIIAAGQSQYFIQALGDDPDTPADEGAVEGEIISFTIDGTPAVEQAEWHTGTTEPLNLTASSGPGDTRVILQPPAEVAPGVAFSVPLVVEAGDAVAGLQSGVLFDSALIQFKSVAAGELFTGCITSGDLTVAGRADVAQVCTAGSAGSPVRLEIILQALASQGGTTQLSLPDLRLFDIDGVELPSISDAVSFVISSGAALCGDVDGDGDRDRDDVRKLIAFILGETPTATQEELANVVIDSELNAGDGVVLLRFADQIIQSLACGPLVQ